MEIQYNAVAFNKIDSDTLYQILRLRSEVFIIEQDCLYQDLDNKDQESYHITLYVNRKLAAYSRLLPAGVSYPNPSIGRVITAPEFRGKGLGKELMAFSIQTCYENFGASNIQISAQVQIIPFYEEFCFETCGTTYYEDGIEHIEMIKLYENRS